MGVVFNRLAKPGARAMFVALALVVGGCSSVATVSDDANLVTSADAPNSAVSALVREGRGALTAKDYGRASRLFNAALKLDVTNANLQFLNSYTYHLMGVAGDSSKLELAEQGLNLALKFDPGLLAARYQLGLLYMDQRRYGLAQRHFAAVALHRGDDPVVLYNLAASSYYAHDPRTAEAALKRLVAINPDVAKKPEILRAQAIASAALNNPDGAAAFLDGFKAEVSDADAVREVQQRLKSWAGFYDYDAKMVLAQANPYVADPNNPFGAAVVNPFSQQDPSSFAAGTTPSGNGPNLSAKDDDPEMVVVDVVLIGTQEDTREARGVNLLNGLQLQFGDPLTGTPGFSFGSNTIKDNLESGLAENTQTITRSINIPAVTYSLNIANSADANNEILAKPSLVAQSGQTSEFFSGTEILAAAVSGGDGDSVSVQKEVGVKLAVTPEVLDNDMIRLHVVAERTFLTDPSNSVVFEFRLDTTKTNINATVTMRYGETLILGGLSERETSRSSDGVPGLMDVPGLNLLFSQRAERNFERSILILMTPRRPQYTRQASQQRENTNAKLSGLERDLERLEKRHKDWYTPRTTFNIISDKLITHEFFQEFRQGDIKIQSWHHDDEKLKKLTSFETPPVVN